MRFAIALFAFLAIALPVQAAELDVNGDAHVTGDLTVDGTLNASVAHPVKVVTSLVTPSSSAATLGLSSGDAVMFFSCKPAGITYSFCVGKFVGGTFTGIANNSPNAAASTSFSLQP